MRINSKAIRKLECCAIVLSHPHFTTLDSKTRKLVQSYMRIQLLRQKKSLYNPSVIASLTTVNLQHN